MTTPTPLEVLAEEIERRIGDLEGTFPWALVFKGEEWRMIANALRLAAASSGGKASP